MSWKAPKINFLISFIVGIAIINFAFLIYSIYRFNDAEIKLQNSYNAEYAKFVKKIETANIKNKNKTIITITAPSNDEFIKEFYTTQTNWLNGWIMLLGIIVAVLGVALPLIFKNQMEKYEKAFKIIDRRANMTLKGIQRYDRTKLDGQVAKIQDDMDQIKEWRRDTKAYSLFSQALNEKEDMQKAIEYYEKAIEIKPDYAAAYCNLGISYGKIGKFEEALSAIGKAIELKPELTEAHCNLGITYSKMGEHEKAIEILENAAINAPNSAEIQYNLGVAYEKVQNDEKMISSFKNATEIKPDFTEAHFNLGTKYLVAKNFDEAINSLEKTTVLNPEHQGAFCNLGAAYANKNEYEKAIKAFEKCLEINPEHKLAKNNLAAAYTNLGVEFKNKEDYNQAIDVLNKAIALKPDNAEAYTNLALTYACMGQMEQALKNIEKAVEINPENQSMKDLHDKIQEDLKNIKKSEPDTPDET